jgi:hypothetical protein
MALKVEQPPEGGAGDAPGAPRRAQRQPPQVDGRHPDGVERGDVRGMAERPGQRLVELGAGAQPRGQDRAALHGTRVRAGGTLRRDRVDQDRPLLYRGRRLV